MVDIEQFVVEKLQHYMENVYTAFPAIVTEVDLVNQKVKAKPAVNFKYRDLSFTEYPIFSNIPLMFPSSSKSALTFPVSKGDTVLLVFSKKGIDKFKASDGKKPVTPDDFRSFDKRDAMAIPGLFPFKNAVNRKDKRTLTHDPNDLVLAHNLGKAGEAEIRIKPDGEIILNSPVKVTVNAPESEFNSNITINGNTQMNGSLTATDVITSNTDVVAGTISLKTHVHGGVTSGGATTAVPQ